jgi:hypothetical protein
MKTGSEFPMAHRKRLSPALKHGAYAATAILPGEDPAAFEKLHKDLVAELGPNGALEDDIVATVARLIWRKKNLATFRIAELARARYEAIEREKTRSEFDVSATRIEEAVDDAREELGEVYALVEIGPLATLDRQLEELQVEERLDGMIDRCIKRLLMVRGVKSLAS